MHAAVVPDSDMSQAEPIEHARKLIAGYKVPKRIELRSEPLPKSAAGSSSSAS